MSVPAPFFFSGNRTLWARLSKRDRLESDDAEKATPASERGPVPEPELGTVRTDGADIADNVGNLEMRDESDTLTDTRKSQRDESEKAS